jgi:hypothetical protein
VRLPPLVALVASLGLLLPAAAGADAPLPRDFSSADQYVESVPTARGPKAPTVERARDRDRDTRPLPPHVTEALEAQGGSESSQLTEVATSPALGAPERRLERSREQPPSVPGATVSALGDGEGDSLVWLLVAIAFVTGALVGLAARRRWGGRGIGGR